MSSKTPLTTVMLEFDSYNGVAPLNFICPRPERIIQGFNPAIIRFELHQTLSPAKNTYL